ncbi:MAG: Stk1 family PASTA domain-containing Ser/Thr kinase [Actinomycetota bacterium]|nr:Stk1 family PASTA domain-containing Ser/Thr kinase [Actinomycetota bacterium]
MSVTDTLINTLFDGRYLVMRKLGTGGMADVYLAEDQELGRRVAIKILNDRHANDDQFVERFRREAKNAASLSHPNIVSVYDRGEAQGTYYIAMEYLGGRTLKELVVERGPAPIQTVIDYARQILSALAFAHRHGIVHRDIKPHNVLVGDDGRVKVTDFGIARAGTSQMTEVGSIIGTAQYLSPEQARGAPVDHRSDLYSVGIVLYELLTGQTPFVGDTPLDVAMKHISNAPVPASSLRPEVTRELDLVVLRALAKNPAERYQSAEDMDAELQRVARGLGVSAETEDAATAILSRPMTTAPTMVAGTTPPVVRRNATYAPPRPYYSYEEAPRRRRPIWPWLLALLLAAAAGVALFVGWQQLQKQLDEARPVTVPFLTGLTYKQAKEQLREADLRAKPRWRPHPTADKGIVFGQRPDAGSKTDRDNAVDVYISNGPPRIEVPDLVGETRESAEDTLEELKLRVKVVLVYSDRPEGTVTGQFPAPGERVVRNTAVRINISRGEKPIGVPNVVGQSFDAARSQLEAAGFRVTRTDAESNQPEGTVLDQDPAAGTPLSKGETVRLTTSKGPQTAIVPDVTNQDQQTATETLKQSGFRVQVAREDVTDRSLSGIVIDQDPSPGASAEPGTVVTIYVGRASAASPDVGGTGDRAPPQ